MTMTSNFTKFFIFQIFIFKLLFTNVFAFSYGSCSSFVNSFIFFFLKLIIYIACFLKDSQNYCVQSLALYTSCLFSTLLNDDIVDIEKPNGICLLTFLVDELSGLFLHPSVFSIIHLRSAYIIDS